MAVKDRSESATVSSSVARTVVLRLSTVVKIVLFVILLGLSFYSGFLYGNSGANSSANDAQLSLLHHFALGLVVYVSPTSLTIANEDNAGTKTYAISPNTIISVNGAKASASQIKAGNRVLIRLSRKNATKADAIIVDTNFSG